MLWQWFDFDIVGINIEYRPFSINFTSWKLDTIIVQLTIEYRPFSINCPSQKMNLIIVWINIEYRPFSINCLSQNVTQYYIAYFGQGGYFDERFRCRFEGRCFFPIWSMCFWLTTFLAKKLSVKYESIKILLCQNMIDFGLFLRQSKYPFRSRMPRSK